MVTDLKYRPEGVRIKHRVNRNSLKMYDKQGSVLRVETTINDAHDMVAYRASEAEPSGEKKWRRLRKGVVDLPRRTEISQAANNRYLTALAAVDAATPLGQVADAVALHVVRDDPAQRRRQSAKVTRLLRLFREHGLILKVQGTQRYQLTAEGRRVLPAFVVARNASTEKLQKLAA